VNVAIAITSGALNVGDEVRKVMGRVHWRPPIKASARSQRIGRRRAFNAMNTRNARNLWDFFMVF
jgi:hypothetical protein